MNLCIFYWMGENSKKLSHLSCVFIFFITFRTTLSIPLFRSDMHNDEFNIYWNGIQGNCGKCEAQFESR